MVKVYYSKLAISNSICYCHGESFTIPKSHHSNIFYVIKAKLLTMSVHTYTPCPQKKYTVCILAITSSNLDQIQKVRWVLKSARSQLFKTVLTFEIWPSRSWENWGQRHQGSFSVFTFLCNFKPFFCVISTKKF